MTKKTKTTTKKTKTTTKKTKWSTEPAWLYNGLPFDLPEDHEYAGFVYRITDLTTGLSYIGKKSLVSKRIKTFKTGRKRRRIVSESDWRRYWSSSDELKARVLEYGFGNFTREVLVLCKTKKLVSYWEERLLWHFRVLEDNTFINSNIGGRFFKVSTEELSSCRVTPGLLLDATSTV